MEFISDEEGADADAGAEVEAEIPSELKAELEAEGIPLIIQANKSKNLVKPLLFSQYYLFLLRE